MSDVKLCDVCGKIMRRGERQATIGVDVKYDNSTNATKLKKIEDTCEDCYKKIYDALFGAEAKK